ncbi:MAG TPA: tRNA uridine-5-carboxymethylaminomethyl(34) synthesis GTPase MnmE [Pseudolabrys sp.]|nr:tRNA uridine-5-carboxymethylaminomethyl(34) synthesis GTPase MnmE [Pseudolabrys sp.]
MSARDTIYALSSGRPPAAIAVIRMSGPRAGEALKALTGKIPKPREAALVRVHDPQSGEIIDEALALWFAAPASETGEDTAELQLHGGRAVIAATLAALSKLEGLRPAEAGEFTRRGFENGKLDLTAVEGLADLVMAETEAQRRQAYRQLRGLLGNRAEAWRQKLIRALALVEAAIDFSDEGDVPPDLLKPALATARELKDEIAAVLADGSRGERLRDGVVVAIAGPPNAGKSTLLNRLARREAAIVSPYAGTTRDVIEVHLDLAGLPVTLLDTAGIRATDDPVEMEGVRRARERAAAADLVLWVEDASAPAVDETVTKTRTWRIRNKIDLLSGKSESGITSVLYTSESKDRSNEALKDMVTNGLTGSSERKFSQDESVSNISAVTGAGFDALLQALTGYAESHLAGAEAALVTRERHRRALKDTEEALGRALSGPAVRREELIAEELRLAARALGRLTGRVDVEDILDVIFRDFCIGK